MYSSLTDVVFYRHIKSRWNMYIWFTGKLVDNFCIIFCSANSWRFLLNRIYLVSWRYKMHWNNCPQFGNFFAWLITQNPFSGFFSEFLKNYFKSFRKVSIKKIDFQRSLWGNISEFSKLGSALQHLEIFKNRQTDAQKTKPVNKNFGSIFIYDQEWDR